MAKITHVELRMIDLAPKVKRVDAIQSFVSQETPIVTVFDSDGASGTGYSYTIGTGGPSVMALLDAARRPAWVWALAGRRQVVWMAVILFATLTVVGGLIVASIYLLRIRPQLVAVESGRLE